MTFGRVAALAAFLALPGPARPQQPPASEPPAAATPAPPAPSPAASPPAAEVGAPVPPAPPPVARPAPAAAPAAPQPQGEPWFRRLRLSGYVGTAWSYGTTYLTLGVGVGYDVFAGLTPSLQASFWAGSPSVWMLQPGVDWFVPLPGRIRPYVGAYWAHWFVSAGYEDRDAIGFRGGLSFAQLGPASMALGVAYEHVYSGCTTGCDYWYPQVSAGIGF